MSDCIESIKETYNKIYPYQSFSNINIIFNSINESNLKSNKKEELINFTFKKSFNQNDINTINSNNAQKLNDLNIYSKNDKNIHKSGHFAKNEKTEKKNNIKENNSNEIQLNKELFPESINQKINNNLRNTNKENYDGNFGDYMTTSIGQNYFTKIDTKTINTEPTKTRNKIIFNNRFKKKNMLSTYNNDSNKSKSKINKNINSSKVHKKIKMIKRNDNNNKLFISYNTNPTFDNQDIKASNIINSNNKSITSRYNKKINVNNNYYSNKSNDFSQKKINDKLFDKLNTINKKISLFSQYNKKLKSLMKSLSKDMKTSSEIYKSKEKMKTGKNNKLTVSPYENKSTTFYSDIKNNNFKKKIKKSINNNMYNINNINTNRNSINRRNIRNHSNDNSYTNISEFNISSNKKNNSKNKTDRIDIYEKSIKKRRVKTNNIFECIHIKII